MPSEFRILDAGLFQHWQSKLPRVVAAPDSSDSRWSAARLAVGKMIQINNCLPRSDTGKNDSRVKKNSWLKEICPFA